MARIADLPRADVDWTGALEEICTDPSRVTPVYQPITDLRRGEACGYEALSRFESTLDANPAEWFTAAAILGYGPLLESAVLSRILEARRDLPPNCFLALNVSPGALVSEEVESLLEMQRDLRGLVLEITEQTPVSDYDRLSASLRRWRQRGAQVAVDDAGAGYASMRHVLALEPDFVKLDRTLIAGAHRDSRRMAAISAFGAFANSMDARLVAEGVEHVEELDALILLDVPLGQGYLMGRPAPGMDPIVPGIGRHIRVAAERQNRDGISALMEHAPSTHDLATEPPVGITLGVDSSRILFLVDELGRPLEVVLRRTGTPDQVFRAMSVAGADAPADVAVRAMARPMAERFAPIACCDEQGRLLGVIRVERLVEALARA